MLFLRIIDLEKEKSTNSKYNAVICYHHGRKIQDWRKRVKASQAVPSVFYSQVFSDLIPRPSQGSFCVFNTSELFLPSLLHLMLGCLAMLRIRNPFRDGAAWWVGKQTETLIFHRRLTLDEVFGFLRHGLGLICSQSVKILGSRIALLWIFCRRSTF